MKDEIRVKIEQLDIIWDEIIEIDDDIRICDEEIKKCIAESEWERAYQLAETKSSLRGDMELLRTRSNVLELTIMAMMLRD